jgi:hypothetical protein
LNSVLTSQLAARWFDWKIKGINDPVMEDYPVLLYVMGRINGEGRSRGRYLQPVQQRKHFT